MTIRSGQACLLVKETRRWFLHLGYCRCFSTSSIKSLENTAQSNYSHLQETLLARNLHTLIEPLSYIPSQKLANSLQTYIPPFTLPYLSALQDHQTAEKVHLPPAWHLIHFNPALPADKLLPDGTDPAQSPGPPFVRRMWAGGALKFSNAKMPILNGQLYECRESIGSVDIKGPPGNEKVFVGIDRRIFGVGDEEFVHERRNIVFLKEHANSTKAASEPPRTKGSFGTRDKTKSNEGEIYSHTLLPTAALLFRFSALTFNAHAIHLDPAYCRNMEGHRNLLVHGPLSLTLLTTLLNGIIREQFGPFDESGAVAVPPGEEKWYISALEYRNVAPLYADEPMTLFVQRKPRKEQKTEDSKAATEAEDEMEDDKLYKLWIENQNGTVAVRAAATVSKRDQKPSSAKGAMVDAIGQGIMFGAVMSIFE